MEDRYAFWILQKDVLITVEGYFKPEEWTDSKSGEKRNRIVMVATKSVSYTHLTLPTICSV